MCALTLMKNAMVSEMRQYNFLQVPVLREERLVSGCAAAEVEWPMLTQPNLLPFYP
jgi:predicted transcriptional regulator